MRKLVIFGLSAVLAACGGGGGGGSTSSTPLTITGTAATGAAIQGGAVAATCQTGTGTATTNSDGGYTLTITNGTLPCLLRVTTTIGTPIVLYSAAETGATTANITPLTQLVVANALGSDPATVYAAGLSTATASNLSSTALTTAVAKIQTALAGLGIDISTIDPLKTTLVAATDNSSGNAQDRQIDGLMVALSNANLKRGDLTTVIANPANTSSAAATAAVAGFAAANGVYTSALASCPTARTGRYVYAKSGNMALNKVFINFDPANSVVTNDATPLTIASMTGWDYGSSSAFTVAQVKDAGDASGSTFTPCAYKFTMASTAVVNVRVSASGVGAFSVGSTFPNSTATLLSASDVGLFMPLQKLPTAADMAGTWYGMHLANLVSSPVGQYSNLTSKFVMDANGNANIFLCSGLGVCDPMPTNSYTSANMVRGSDNILTATTTVDPTPTQLAIFRNQTGDIVVLGVNTAPSLSMRDNFVIYSNRVSAFKTRVAGSSYSAWVWSISNSAIVANGLKYTSAFRTWTVNSVDTANNSFTRTSNDATPVVDTIFLNTPQAGIGMFRRPAVTTPVFQPDIVGFTGNGWSISGATRVNATTTPYMDSSAANNFLTIVIHSVN